MKKPVKQKAPELKAIELKQIWESITVWFNAVLFVLPELIWIVEEIVREEIITTPSYVNIMLKGIAIANIVLRLKSKQGIKLP